MRSFAFPVLATVAAISASAIPAAAQESAPFTGARVEGLVGYDNVHAGGHDDGVAYGIAAGYDRQFRGLLVGAEVEAADSDLKSCGGLRTAADPELCAKTGRDLYAGGRVGTVIGGRALVYAKAGYTNARFSLTQDAGAGRTTLGHTDLDGVRLGVGAEYAVGPNSFVKAEYRYSNYQDGFERNQAVAGFGFRF